MTTQEERQRGLAYAIGKSGRSRPAWVEGDEALLSEFDRGRRDVHAESVESPVAQDAASDDGAKDSVAPQRKAAEEPEGDPQEPRPEPAHADTITWRQAKARARQLGARHEALPSGFARYPQLVKAHRSAWSAAEWRHPFGVRS